MSYLFFLYKQPDSKAQACGNVVGIENRYFVASVRPAAPIMAMYIQEIVRILALPQVLRQQHQCLAHPVEMTECPGTPPDEA